ncbi:hypothetical protein SOVF_136030 [Spinacia oleracea]|uniref:DUF3741 domain-containing protein n=1 Tax=Spinacia oleracea TaxID=3562 RepID=A0A9R0JF59_SPIOL|nr:uncharacterized protein LOC110804691 [Spinacia oleracea]KNA11351.1 hypothetical protein SOVF_136030 [Spinacia oleracea]
MYSGYRMVGMDAQGIHEKSIERDFVSKESLEPCGQANGNLLFQLKDSGTPTTAAGGECNNKRSVLCPITPTPRRENGDSVFVASTPLSVESPQSPNVDSFNSTRNEEVVAVGLDASPRTPNEGVFDPFAPGPDEMLLAPICKKLVRESRRIVARRLNFDDLDDLPASKEDNENDDFTASKEDNENEDSLIEKVLLETVYGTLLEAIILKQSEEFFAENQPLKSEDPRTPSSPPPPLMGFAETCPGAPVKAANGKSRNIDAALCRKLEF